MRKAAKLIYTIILILSVLFTSVVAASGDSTDVALKKWDFLADSYAKGQGFPTTNTWKDLDGNAVWSTYNLADGELTELKPVNALNGATPAMWSKDGTQNGAPLMQIRPATANMFLITPSMSGTPVLRWTSNIRKTVKVTALVKKNNSGGNGTALRLYKNMNELVKVIVAGTDTEEKVLTQTISVVTGDTIEVAINAIADSTNDQSSLNVIIEEVESLIFDSVPTFSFTDCGEPASSIVPGGTIGATLGGSNHAEEISLIGILAVYTEDNVLSGLSFDKITLAPGESKTINCHIEDYTPVGYTGDFRYKMFVLDSLSQLHPLYNGFSYPPEEKRVWDFEKDNIANNFPSTVPYGDAYGASEVWSIGMGNHDATVATRPYDFRPMLYDNSINIWYNGEEPKMAVTHNFPTVRVSPATGLSELQPRSRTAAQQATEGTKNARLHPIIRFISPLTGEVHIKLVLEKKNDGGDGLLLMMGQNGTISAENASLISIGSNKAVKEIEKTVYVTKGMTLDFMLHGLADNSSDVSRLGITITER